jgi:predicted dehydrogenase
MSKGAVKTAVVGVGSLGRHHAKWYKALDEADLVGVYDLDRSRSEAVAKEFGVKVFENLDDLCGEVEAVSVATTTSSHYDVVKKCLVRGLSCLVEKPITTTLDQARELIELSKSSGSILTVGHIERFNPAVSALKGYDVKPAFIEAHRLAPFNPRGADVAVILDLMIHDIDLVLQLIKSDVDHIEASAVSVVSSTADIANARIRFKNGAVANLTASRISLHAMRKLRIFQSFGYFSLDLAAREADIYVLDETRSAEGAQMKIPLGNSGREISYVKIDAADEDMLGTELKCFVQSVRTKQSPVVSAEDATSALEVALEIERISASGCTVMT